MAEYGISGPLYVESSALKASSTLDPLHVASFAPLNPISANYSLSCWKPQPTDKTPWIQVDLGTIKVIRGVTTRGNPFAAEWISQFTLKYRIEDGSKSFADYMEPYGTVKVNLKHELGGDDHFFLILSNYTFIGSLLYLTFMFKMLEGFKAM